MSKLTPMMEQFFDIKEKYEDSILFFRLGDFYEMFFDDAIVASRELDITLTGRDCGMEERAPMCGVPFHSADSYIAKLVQKGYKVAICEQVQDPKDAVGIVKREVVRVVTPGTLMDTKALDENKNNYAMSIYEDTLGFGIAVADVTTGDFSTTSFNKDEYKKVIDEVAKYNPAEIIVNQNYTEKNYVENIFNINIDYYKDKAFEYSNALITICEHFNVVNLNSFGIEDDSLATIASGALLDYLHTTQMNELSHITTIKKYTLKEYMFLDIHTRKNLELSETIRDNRKKGSLLWVMDRTVTSMGSRLLRKWVEEPLINPEEINLRLDGVEEYKEDFMFTDEMRDILNTIYDIERILGRIIYGTANARDLISLKKSLEHLPTMKLLLMRLNSKYNNTLYEKLDTLEDIYSLINKSIVEEPPFTLRDGGFIKEGYNEELDRYLKIKNKSSNWLKEYESKLREETGIKNLKIGSNKVFGYYIEITNSYKDMVPDHFVRRQTLTNAERYITDKLKEMEDEIFGADEKIVDLEYKLFVEIRGIISKETARLQECAKIIATIDVLQSLGVIANENHYIKPEINNSGEINITDGRHPVVEKVLRGDFVPNDGFLDLEDNRLSIITGPNMAGKSTYMRQIALIVLMAQVGSFVPAKKAKIGVVDRIFTRVGASDDLSTGQSTFMVEMNEVAEILNNATRNSLLILDEIGRGTSTFDGLSIAWAVLEYIADKNNLGAKTLFSTHYHELTELEGRVDGVINYRVTVEERGKDIIFLRKIERGGADRSYGIHVARIAGIPDEVIDRANTIMLGLLQSDMSRNVEDSFDDNVVYYSNQLPKDNKKKNRLFEDIKDLDIDSMSPRDALMKLYDIKIIASSLEED